MNTLSRTLGFGLATMLVALGGCDEHHGGGSSTSNGGSSGSGGTTTGTGGSTGGTTSTNSGGTGGDTGTGGNTGGNTSSGGTGGNTNSGGTGGNTSSGGTGGDTGMGGNTGGTGGAGGSTTTSTTTTTSMPCNNVFIGNFTIQTQDNVDAITPYCEIQGDVTVKGGFITTLPLPNLRKMSGKLGMLAQFTSVDLHALETATALDVRGDTLDLSSLQTLLTDSNMNAITPLSLPKLTSAGGHLSITASDSVDMPVLTNSGILSMSAQDCVSGIAVSTPLLTTAGGYQIACPKSMNVASGTSLGVVVINRLFGVLAGPTGVNLSFPALTTVSFFDVDTTGTVSAPNLVTVTDSDLKIKEWSGMDLGKLQTIGRDLWIYNAALTNLNLPSLTSIGHQFKLGGDDLGCDGGVNPNPQLTMLTLPQLATLGLPGNNGLFLVGANPMLPKCRIDAVLAQLTAHGWTGFSDFHLQSCPLPAGPCP